MSYTQEQITEKLSPILTQIQAYHDSEKAEKVLDALIELKLATRPQAEADKIIQRLELIISRINGRKRLLWIASSKQTPELAIAKIYSEFSKKYDFKVSRVNLSNVYDIECGEGRSIEDFVADLLPQSADRLKVPKIAAELAFSIRALGKDAYLTNLVSMVYHVRNIKQGTAMPYEEYYGTLDKVAEAFAGLAGYSEENSEKAPKAASNKGVGSSIPDAPQVPSCDACEFPSDNCVCKM